MKIGPLGWTAITLLGLVEVVAPIVLVAARNRFLFFPSQDRPESALAAFGTTPVSVVRFTRPDGRSLSAYDVRPTDAGRDAPVVLFLHGNAGSIASRARLADRFARETRWPVRTLEYSGFGGNDGSPSEDEINADALAAYDDLVRGKRPAPRVAVFGESIGGGPALYVATRREVVGLALQSTFSSLSSMALRLHRWTPLAALLVTGSFPNARRAAELTRPLLIVHGVDDVTVPIAEARAICEAAPAAELLEIAGADHNDLFDVAGPTYLASLGERFRRWSDAAARR